jgi:hypothetical protein
MRRINGTRPKRHVLGWGRLGRILAIGPLADTTVHIIAIEMKSLSGKCSPSKRAFRERLLGARVEWWVCRSADAAMWALSESGVTFRTLVRNDGTTERWQPPKLERWNLPRRDPSEPRPRRQG